VNGTHRAALLLVGLLALAMCVMPTEAHQINLTSARLDIGSDRRVALELALKGSDVDRVAGTKVFDEATGLVDARRLAAAAAVIGTYVTTHAVFAGADGTPCEAGAVSLAPDQDGVVARLTWSCGAVAGDLLYRSTVLIASDPAAKQVVLIGTGAQTSQALLDRSRTELRLTAPPPSLLETVGRYVEAGVEHIFLGYDHIAFLIAVVLWARRLWPVIKIVTAFTLAHSITLSLAALEIVVIPSAIVEPAIAASIVFVAVENFFSRDVDRRWRDTFGFGLIHGFGFASALQEFGLPRGQLVPALASFNLGVELGQVAIVSLVVPALILLDRLVAAARGVRPARAAALVYPLSGAIAVIAGYWVMARTFLA
jgi:hydrogenase/urease accessory protein HupE